MGYPSGGYRSAVARALGGTRGAFNTPSGGFSPVRFGIPANLPTPANFNLPVPANDNVLGAARRGASRGALVARRVFPALAIGLAAYELWQWHNHGQNRIMGKATRVDLSYWTIGLNCSGTYDSIRWNNLPPNCAADQVIGPGTGTPQTGPAKSFAFWQTFPLRYYINGVSLVAQPGVVYTAFKSGPVPAKSMPYTGWPLAEGLPLRIIPALNPAAMPVNAFNPVPMPIPWSVAPGVSPNPREVSSQSLQQGYGPQPGGHAAPVGDPLPSVDIATGAGQLPSSLPRGQAEPLPNSAPRAEPHSNTKPPRGTKERKWKANVGASFLIRRLYDAATETEDFLDAIYWSIPHNRMYGVNGDRQAYLRTETDRPRGSWWKDPLGKWHRRSPSAVEKADYIRKHWRDIDIQKAIHNLAENQVKDWAFGKFGKAAGKAAQNTHDKGLGSPSRGYSVTRAAGHF